MNFTYALLIALFVALLVILFLAAKLLRVRGQLFLIEEALGDIKSGNLNRRMLTKRNDMTKKICYDINEIAMNSQTRLIRQKRSEQAYKRLMTSISHDVKTPLASLVGYLEAVERKMVTGEEKDEYVHVAYEKACYLKHFVENLFEWVKLDSGEQMFRFEQLDFNELSRDIIAGWIPVLENGGFAYEFDIPETEYLMRMDANAYSRILNNLLQNALIHSGGNTVTFRILENGEQAEITIADNGREYLPTIFRIFLKECTNATSRAPQRGTDWVYLSSKNLWRLIKERLLLTAGPVRELYLP